MSVPNPPSNPNKPCKNSFHWRKDSEELDVFEAAGYFSTVNDPNPGDITRRMIREERHHVQKPGRMSLDNMSMRNPIPAEYLKQMKEKSGKKCKQPSSPGGRLASFLNSLFNQASLKKKKPKSGGSAAAEEINPGGRRKRRSSISHFRITTKAADSKAAAFSSASGSGFRTPPPYVNTPTKLNREFKNLPDRRQAIDFLPGDDERNDRACEWMVNRNSTANWGHNSWELRKFRDGDDDDDGPDSDSSSDLFDLPNHELDFYSRDLPVYGTTCMDRIKMGAPISSATT